MVIPYFPDNKAGQAEWYANMATEFPGVAADLNFSNAARDAWVADCRYAAYLLGPFTVPFESFNNAVNGYAFTVVSGSPQPNPVALPELPAYDPAAPAAVAPGIDGRRQRTVDAIKAATAYTPDVIGKLLRTEPTGTPFDPDAYVGEIKNVRQTGPAEVSVVFGKASGAIDEVILFRQRQGDAAPVKVDKFSHSPAVDEAPLLAPNTMEERTYFVQGVIKNRPIGSRSAGKSVTVKP